MPRVTQRYYTVPCPQCKVTAFHVNQIAGQPMVEVACRGCNQILFTAAFSQPEEKPQPKWNPF